MLDKEKIPHGDYCYSDLKIVEDPVFGFRSKHVACPYWRRRKINGVDVVWCDFLNSGGMLNEDFDMSKLIEHYGSEDNTFKKLPLSLLFDQVKECGENNDEENQ